MKLQDIVVEAAVIPDLHSTERDAALTEIVDALAEAGAFKKSLRDEFIKSLIKREKRGSTGFGHGVAVPHVKHADVKEMAVGIGISRDGVDFNALDQQPVYSIFLLLSPEESPENHLDAMEAIFGNLQQPTFRRFLAQASTVEEVMTLMKEADAKTAAR